MKMGGTLRCLFWAVLYCVLYLVSASEDDLMDFDFTDLKEIDWNYENDNSQELLTKGTTQENIISFDDDNDLLEENQVHPFDWREKVLRTALSKALSNKSVRQKFVEVMPILRVLSKQQRLALSALITAQINAKKGNELKLEQVRMMFGDDKSLILPIVYDIANLVRNSAKKYIEFDYNLADFGDFSKTKISYERRNLDLTPEELAAEENNEGIAALPATLQMVNVPAKSDDDLEDFFPDMSDEVLDPKEINEELEMLKVDKLTNSNTTMNSEKLESKEDMEEEVDEEEDEEYDDEITDPMEVNLELQKDVPTLTLLKLNKTEEQYINIVNAPTTPTTTTTKTTTTIKTTTTFPPRRLRRSAQNTEFIHKLIRSVPLSVNEEELHRANAGRTVKLNTTAFASPKDKTIQPSASVLPTTTATPVAPPTDAPTQDSNIEPYQIVEDLAFASLNGSEISLADEENIEPDVANDTILEPQEELLPTPEELIAGPRYRVSGNKYMQTRPKIVASKRNRVQVRSRPQQALVGNGVMAPKKCERFTASMCIKTEDYPMDQIMGSIRRHRNAMTALLAEYTDKPLNSLDTTGDFDDYLFAKKRREDNDVQGGLCQSIVRYARPQKARSASGEWKYIVNTGQHTQTLRLEKCMNPQESCSYLAANYRSHCSQVYNYHRLLSWDKTRGLHVDIFKVPTCCSCQIDGYKQQFPALAALKNKEFSSAFKGDLYRHDHDFEEEDADEDDEFNYGLHHQHHQHDSGFDANELLSSSNRIKNKLPGPTVGSYLSPPGSEEYEQYAYKSQRDTSAAASSNTKFLKDLARRRPQKSYSDKRSDQEYSPSEQHAEREVNVFGTPIGNDERNHQKRKTISSVTHTASTSNRDSSTTAITASTGTIRAFTPATLPSPTTTDPFFGRPFTDTNAHQKPSGTTTVTEVDDESVSTTLPSSAVSAATLPSHYYTRSRNVLKNKYRLRIPYTSTTTHSGGSGDVFVSGGETSATTDTTEHVTTTAQQPDVYAVNPEIFNNHYKTKFNLTTHYSSTENSTSSVSPSTSSNSPPKRINYSYHPIIDFFEYNKRMTARTTTTTTTRPPTNKPSSQSSTKYLSSTHLYPHKIPKSVPANIYQQPQNYSPSKKQQQQNERRIGYGAAGDGSRVVFPNSNSNSKSNSNSNSNTYISSSSSSSGSHKTSNDQSNENSHNSKYPLQPTSQPNPGYESAVTDVWHPVIKRNY